MNRGLPFEWVVALRFLVEGRMQTLLILAGATAGVAVIVFLTQLIAQLQATIIDRTLGSQAHIVIRPPDEVNRRGVNATPDGSAVIIQPREQRLRSIDQWEAIAKAVAQVDGVTAVSPVVSGPGFAFRGTASKSIVLLGVDAARYKRIVKMDSYITAGRFQIDGDVAVIGVELAADLGVKVGDKLRIASAEGREDIVTVGGIFDIGNRDLNRRWVFVTLKLGQSLLNLAGGVSNIDLTVGDIFEADRISEALRPLGDVKVESWMQTNAQLLAALRNQSISNRLIRSFVIAIVALGIASVLVVSVVQKQKEIGILRAMGAHRRSIMMIFLLQGGVVGLTGSLMGSAVGYGLLSLFSHVYKNSDGTPIFTNELSLQLVIWACVVATVTGLVSAILPARRAARLDPVVAIRA